MLIVYMALMLFMMLFGCCSRFVVVYVLLYIGCMCAVARMCVVSRLLYTWCCICVGVYMLLHVYCFIEIAVCVVVLFSCCIDIVT